VKDYVEGRVYHERDLVVAGDGALYQAERDTAATPPHTDWRCITRAGRDGKDAVNFLIEGTYDPGAKYRWLSIVMLNGSSFVARHDNPGPCPGDGWQLFTSVGKRGQNGAKGERGERSRGARAIAPPSPVRNRPNYNGSSLHGQFLRHHSFARRSAIPDGDRTNMRHHAIQPFHRDDLKHVRELTYLRASTETYFLLGVRGCKLAQATFRLTPVLLDGSDGPIMELGEMRERFNAQNGD
jgi:hypothetical protein